MTLREAMALAADRDLVARQYANGFREVLHEALPVISASLHDGQPLETAILPRSWICLPAIPIR